MYPARDSVSGDGRLQSAKCLETKRVHSGTFGDALLICTVGASCSPPCPYLVLLWNLGNSHWHLFRACWSGCVGLPASIFSASIFMFDMCI